ncbi:TonB-dependent receptor, partial [Flavobacterium circumlabens]
ANSLQVEFNYELIHNLNLRTAYKYYDIQTDYLRGTFQRPLQAKHRFLGNLEYETSLNDDRQWKFDYTFNWSGKQQLPYTASNPAADQFPDFSPSYAVMNMQVTRVFSSVFEVY